MNVILDAGHGKNTAGKRSPDSSLMEYEFNEDICVRARNLLKDNKFGVQVHLTREPGQNDVPLAERCRIARNRKGDILFSIHANAFNPIANVKQPDGSIRSISQNIWNSGNGFEVFFAHKNKTAESSKLADYLIENMKSVNELYKIRFRRKESNLKHNFYMLNGVAIPSILVEYAFFTNRVECETLKNPQYRDLCARALVKTILQWHENHK